MTKMKKVLGMVMVALMCFALTPMAAFAETVTNQNQGKITIDNAIDGKDYTIYQMLQLIRYNPEKNSYSYKAVDQWAAFLGTADAKKYVDVSADGYVTWINADTEDNVALPVARDRAIAEFAALAIDYAKDNGIAGVTKKATDGEVEFAGLSLGYYLVDSSTGAICSLATTNPDASIVEKNGVPTVDKRVQEDSNIGDATDGYDKTNDAQIGDTVKFKTTITGQPGAVNYVLHDTMDKGLAFIPGTVKAYRGETVLEAGVDYTLNAAPTDGCTFELTLTETLCNDLGENDQIVVYYSATLTNEAVVNGNGNKNSTELAYGDGVTVHKTPKSETTTYTWGISVFKHDEANAPLPGAAFTLSLNSDGTNPLNLIPLGNNIYKVATEAIADTTVTEIATDATGAFEIQGIDADTYYLTETKAPDGFNKLPGAITVTLSDKVIENGTIKTASVDVLNEAGSLLPSTGGIGTTILYVVGGILVIGAIIYLVRRRSHSA